MTAAATAARTWRTLAELVAALAARGAAPALAHVRADGVARIGYAELGARAAALARGLVAAGVRRGEPVLIWGPNSIDWVIVRLALVACGAVGVALDEVATEAELAVLVPDSGARRAFTVAANFARLAAVDPALDIRTLDDGPRSWRAIPEAPGTALPALEPGDDVAIVYTSGTTGKPKSFALTHANILANVDALAGQGLVGAEDRVLLPLPLHHVYPLTVGIFVAFACGCEIVLPDSVTGPQLVAALRAGRCTIMLGVPRLYAALVQGLRLRVAARGLLARVAFDALLALSIAVRRRLGVRIGRRLFAGLHRQLAPELWLMASGGAKLEAELIWTLEGLGWEALSGYGLAETASIFTNNRRGESRVGSEGVPLDGGEIRIAEPDAAGTGEIEMRGPSVFRGYRDDAEANAAAFTADGWFRTGDLGHVDSDGFVWVTGRLKEMIALGGGRKIYPEELEKLYAASPFIEEIAVLEREGALVGLARPRLEAVAASGNLQLEDVVRVALAETGFTLPAFQRLAGFAIAREKLPRTRLGKIRRFELPGLYAASRSGGVRSARPLTDADRALLADPLAADLLAWLRARYADRAVDLDASPQLDLGIDSLEWVTITLEIASRFAVAFTEEDGATIFAVRDLLARARERVGASEAAAPGTLGAAELAWLAPRDGVERALGAVLHTLNAGLMRALFRPRVEGLQHVPRDGAFLIAVNHASDLDPLVLAAALDPERRARLRWSGDAGRLFRGRVLPRLARALRIFPVRERATATTLAFAAEVLRRGDSLAWFPESWRSPDGALQGFRPGIGRLLLDHPVPVVPARIAGAFEAMPRTARLPRPHPIAIRFGAKLEPAVFAGLATPQAVADRIRDAVAALASPPHR